MELYDASFMADRLAEAGDSAAIVVALVVEELGADPQSVIDVGCGSGGWLIPFAGKGTRCVGVDGEYAKHSFSAAESTFIARDLSVAIQVPGQFDLAICLEVAEHLPATRALGLVEELVALSSNVLFSAATVGQPGDNHINCQPQSYWAELFAQHDYAPVDCVRPEIWGTTVSWWYQQNVLLYRHKAVPCLKYPLDLYHPTLVAQLIQLAKRPPLRWLLRRLPAATRQAIGRRTGR